MNTAIGFYKEQQIAQEVFSKNKIELVVLLYNKVVEHLQIVVESIKAGDIKRKQISLDKANKIIEKGLLDFLNPNAGEVSNTLKSFYEASLLVLLEANLKNNSKDIEKIADSFKELGSAWSEINIRQ